MFRGQFGTRNYPVNEASMNFMFTLGGLTFMSGYVRPSVDPSDGWSMGGLCFHQKQEKSMILITNKLQDDD